MGRVIEVTSTAGVDRYAEDTHLLDTVGRVLYVRVARGGQSVGMYSPESGWVVRWLDEPKETARPAGEDDRLLDAARDVRAAWAGISDERRHMREDVRRVSSNELYDALCALSTHLSNVDGA